MHSHPHPQHVLLPLSQLPVSLECYTEPPEDNLALLQLYFRALVTGALCPRWCPVLYAVAVAHVNSFLFSQDPRSSVSYIPISKGWKRHCLWVRGGGKEGWMRPVMGVSPWPSAISPSLFCL